MNLIKIKSIRKAIMVGFLSLMLIFSASAEHRSGPIPQSEREALVALYESTDGKHWKNNDKWMDPPGTECNWYGVSCQPEEPFKEGGLWHVYGIDLFDNNLNGQIPSELGALQELSHLCLFDNNLSGNFPVELGSLNLEELLIFGNHFSGELPSALLAKFDDGSLRLHGYAGQFSPIIQIEFNYRPTAIICGEYHAVLKQDGSVTLKTKKCRMKHRNDRATYWETKQGYIDRYVSDFDRLARMIEVHGFYRLDNEYTKLITHGAFETLTVTHLDGKQASVEDYAEAGPMNLWLLKRIIVGAIFNAEWEKTEKSKPET